MAYPSILKMVFGAHELEKKSRWLILCILFVNTLCTTCALRCERSTQKTGRLPSTELALDACLTYEEFQNNIITAVDKARGRVDPIPHGISINEEVAGGRRTGVTPIPEIVNNNTIINDLLRACVTFSLQVDQLENEGENGNSQFHIEIRDCLRLSKDELDQFHALGKYNCEESIAMEDTWGAPIRATRYVCMCQQDDCNTKDLSRRQK